MVQHFQSQPQPHSVKRPSSSTLFISSSMSQFFRLCLALAALIPLSPHVAAQGPNAFKEQCLSFKPEKLVQLSTQTRLEYIANGTTLEFPDNVASCNRPSQLVSTNVCRVALSIPTSNSSGITFELWLPEDWPNARYISTGNGGVDGCPCLCC